MSASIRKPSENEALAWSIAQGEGDAAELVCPNEHRLHQEAVQGCGSSHGVFPT